MVDFTCFQTRRKAYGGANGNKLSIIINDELWMLKLPSHAWKNANLSYSNSSLNTTFIFQKLTFQLSFDVNHNYAS